MAESRDLTPQGYDAFVGELKERIRTAQVRAALTVNRELILLYWSIGRDILSRQELQGWGAKIIDRMRPPTSRTRSRKSVASASEILNT